VESHISANDGFRLITALKSDCLLLIFYIGLCAESLSLQRYRTMICGVRQITYYSDSVSQFLSNSDTEFI